MRPVGGAPAPSAKAWRVARLLELDRAAVEICLALPHAILLKGPTFANWLYPDSPRARLYTDVDILCPVDVEQTHILKELGFERSGDHPLGIHTTWVRRHDNVTVELHSTLLGIGIDAAEAWDILSAETEVLDLTSSKVLQLNERARTVHVCLHAAGDGNAPQPLEDLKRACLYNGLHVWEEAAELAHRLGALDACARGLRSISDGQRVAVVAGFPFNRSVTVELRANGASNAAQALGLLDDSRGARAKWELVKKLARVAESDKDAGGLGLRIARVVRAIPEWWRARRALRKSP